MPAPYLQQLTLNIQKEMDRSRFPFSLPFLADLLIRFDRPVTFFVGENGSGKSTLLEAIADLAGLPISGGTANELYAGHGPAEVSELAGYLRAGFMPRPKDAYFFRAELQANFASLLDKRSQDPDFGGDPYSMYGGKSLHRQSHGEAFLSVIQNRFKKGLFLLDEPESALSPQRQLTLMAMMYQLTSKKKSQFIVATHSPTLLTFPGARILSFDGTEIVPIDLQDTSHYQITRGILENPEQYWQHLRVEED
ncbi:MAG: putative ATPase [Planctomycetota bacterium]